ncbi:MAG: hypothetical protein KTV77_00930 [Wolbachia endosymbiont of Fragariocoptes setiger]|nr:hypothetical protein [Wolbachia endosymbiont of Fragariocoptes setiger]
MRLHVETSIIIIQEEMIVEVLIERLKRTVEQLLKECSKDDQINSALTNTMTEVQQQSSSIV